MRVNVTLGTAPLCCYRRKNNERPFSRRFRKHFGEIEIDSRGGGRGRVNLFSKVTLTRRRLLLLLGKLLISSWGIFWESLTKVDEVERLEGSLGFVGQKKIIYSPGAK